MRAVTQVAEQKLGPDGGQMPDAEATQLAELQRRAAAMQPEVEHALAEFGHAKQALARAQAQLAALRQSQQKVARKKRALGGVYQQKLAARAEGVSEAEIEQRAALADLGRAVLAAGGAVEIPEGWLERLSRVCEHADRLVVRREMQRRAIKSYDHERARQGVRLSCTAIALVFALFAFKLIF
jgi:chromosome segregation ATPase